DPVMRSYGDLDLLVRQRDIRRATESLLATGYQATVPVSAIDAGKIPGQYLFTNRNTKLLVELHNDFTLRYFPRRLPLEKCFARRTLVHLDVHEIPTLSVEDELVYICIHGTKHFWERLIWIADVAALVSRQTDIDWQGVTETAKEVGAGRMLRTGLCLASDLLHARLPDAVLADVQADRGAAKLAACVRTWLATGGHESPSLVERAAFRLRMRGSGFLAPAYLLRLSLSPTEDDWQANGGVSDNGLLDALRRPFRLARKYGRSNKS
ncbi:MAG: nucleotidyltransferase family protein, partial [Candidatus Acidiferrales bacterium]